MLSRRSISLTVAGLKRVRSGAFKARKALPEDIREAYAKLYGQRWEAIFWAPAGTHPDWAKFLHAEWLVAVERRVMALRFGERGEPVGWLQTPAWSRSMWTLVNRYLPWQEWSRLQYGPAAPVFHTFPKTDSPPGYRGPAVKARERLAAWVRQIGVTDNNVSPNHAWRHTFKRRAARAVDRG
jgi:hypothetical protein